MIKTKLAPFLVALIAFGFGFFLLDTLLMGMQGLSLMYNN